MKCEFVKRYAMPPLSRKSWGNSFYSRESILRAYGLDAEVCYLGVDETRFTADDSVSRLPFFSKRGLRGLGKERCFHSSSAGTTTGQILATGLGSQHDR